MNPKISIVIPCFNDAEFIGQSVNSALNQTYANKEIIVVDDGSDDQTKKVLQILSSKIKLITQENSGTSTARNRGIKASQGDFILVLDSDDYFEPQFCEKAVELLINEQAKIVTCYFRWINLNGKYKISLPSGGDLRTALIKNPAMGSVMFYRNDWRNVGGYDETMLRGYEDWEFYIRILENGGVAKVIPEVLFNYRNKPASRNKKANLKKYELLEYIYLKHSNLYKEHFPFFIKQWLDSVKKSEAFKQQVMDSVDYKVGNKILKPLRFFGLFKKNKNR